MILAAFAAAIHQSGHAKGHGLPLTAVGAGSSIVGWRAGRRRRAARRTPQAALLEWLGLPEMEPGTMSPSQPQGQPQPPWTRLAGTGFEFGASLAVFMLLGYWVDRHWAIQKHWGLLIGMLLGLVGGTYNFIREARRAIRQSQRPGPKRPDQSAGNPPGDGADGQR